MVHAVLVSLLFWQRKPIDTSYHKKALPFPSSELLAPVEKNQNARTISVAVIAWNSRLVVISPLLILESNSSEALAPHFHASKNRI